MALRIRKLIVVSVIAAVILLANTWLIAGWLDGVGVIAWARNLRSQYVTGTAITIITALLVLLPSQAVWAICVRRCPVCDALLLRRGKYCAECGSRT